MPRRLVAVVVAAAMSLGASVLAACELACSFDAPVAAASVPSHPAACHESSPSAPSRCSDRHALRLAVVDGGAASALAAPPAAPPLTWTTSAEPIVLMRFSPVASAPPSASPPLILRV